LRDDGSYGVLDLGAASDADQDTALALLFAARRWQAPAYQQAALTILDGIWREETTVAADRRYLVAGNWARGGTETGDAATVNPSYLAPYAYRIFAQADPNHDWSELVDTSYDLLAAIQAGSPDGRASLAPNWVGLDVATAEVRPAEAFGPYAEEVSFDASRLPWRLAVDLAWFGDPRARDVLSSYTILWERYERDARLVAAYQRNGVPAAEYESLSLYAGVVSGLLLVDSEHEELWHQVFADKVLRRYTDHPQGAYWGDPDNYYDQNWAWFATALVDGAFSNLWAGETVINWQTVPSLTAVSPPVTGSRNSASVSPQAARADATHHTGE
jgi:endoglucanase